MSLNPDTIPGEITTRSLYVANFSSNANSAALDIRDYKGKLAVVLNAAAATDNNQAINVELLTGGDTNVANAVSFSPAITFTAIAANGGATVETVAVDTRVANRYLYARPTRASAGNGRVVSLTVAGKVASNS